MLIPPGDPDTCWELFHENSKVSRFDTYQAIEVIRKEMLRLHESLPYEDYPKVELPNQITSLEMPLGDAICGRRSIRELRPVELNLQMLATILYYSYGITGNSKEIPRSFRAAPSGGALYPLELYLYTAHVQGLQPGLYHYNPCTNQLSFLNELDNPAPICQSVLQPELVAGASVVLFITALFERTIFKYADRGYRFVLMEAGHLAQNLLLVLQGLRLAGITIGGFFDREIDKLLRLNGLTQSTLYMVAVGQNAEVSKE